jgi:hypothetical protein
MTAECYLCGTPYPLDLTVRVDFGVFVTEVCVLCLEKADPEETDATE